jgi:C1A family cysteine protease
MPVLERHPNNRRFGWRPQERDALDEIFRAPRSVMKTAPRVFKNSQDHPHAPYDQMQEGSCVGNGIAAQYAFYRKVAGYKTALMFSRSFIYYHARKIQGWQRSDTGCFPRDAAKVINKLGAPIESIWDYSGAPAGPDWVYPAGHRSQKEPTDYVVKNASIRQCEGYKFVPRTMSDIRAAISMRKPVGFGFLVYESFYDRETGKPVNVLRPPVGQEHKYGGHYVVAMDYDDDERLAFCLNSWGVNNQINGYFYVSYDMLMSEHASDFLVLDAIENTKV